MSLLTQTDAQKLEFQVAMRQSDPSMRIGRSPAICIAAADAPTYVKDRSDYVCGGANDDLVLNAAIAGLPSAGTQYDGANHSGNTGKMGSIQMTEGRFIVAQPIVVPAWSVMDFNGMGQSSWIPIDGVTQASLGGTTLYTASPTADIFAVAQTSFNTPGTRLNMSGINFVALNPAANTTKTVVSLNGSKTGDVSKINVLVDTSQNATHQINRGFAWDAGGASSRKTLIGLNSYGFRQTGISLNTTHLAAISISGGDVSGDAYSTAIQLTPQDDCYFAAFQCFGSRYGLAVTNNTQLQAILESLHIESCTTPMLIDSVNPVYIRSLNIDSGVTWTGDLATKVRVETLQSKGRPTKRASSMGKVTMLAGTTTAVIAHNLIAAPTLEYVVPKGYLGAGVGYSWGSDATNITITATAAVATDTVFHVMARVGV